ncbi:hypothetical protein [Streptomyces sp. ALI-76-A]|jgi:hypothetical protein|uniref:hypothetical protein n=1 Tax=Streptomyces sp. ALI-76-A TaxID=3025736 RepID=UPI00256ECF85|nr:hypothetical protein [Streptomyces sp. ALI-76-A]MDL5205787.1 hypothetical protein [Streptomyces sp. ALI-76-A]
MYEMWIGSAAAGEALVWHVLAADKTVTLCGVQRSDKVDQHATDRHCLPCMAAFQRAMESSGPAKTEAVPES